LRAAQELRPDAGIVETRRDAVRLEHLPVFVLQQIRARTVQYANAARRDRSRSASAVDALASGFHAPQPHVLIRDEAREDADRIAAAAEGMKVPEATTAIDARNSRRVFRNEATGWPNAWRHHYEVSPLHSRADHLGLSC